VAHLVEIALRELTNVLAAIAVLGKRRTLAQELLRARADRDRKVLDLLARVVVVVLARDGSALPVEQRRDDVAQRRLPAVADVQRSDSPIRTPLSHARLHARRPADRSRSSRIRVTIAVRAVGVRKIDEAAPAISVLPRVERAATRRRRPREFARIALHRLRVLKRDVRRSRRASLLRLDGDRPAARSG
jgi:hypothetical protein